MLFFPVGSSKPVRVQGAFLSDEEVEEVVDFVIDQQKAQYQEDMIPDDIPEKTRGEVEDELYGDAVDLSTRNANGICFHAATKISHWIYKSGKIN